MRPAATDRFLRLPRALSGQYLYCPTPAPLVSIVIGITDVTFLIAPLGTVGICANTMQVKVVSVESFVTLALKFVRTTPFVRGRGGYIAKEDLEKLEVINKEIEDIRYNIGKAVPLAVAGLFYRLSQNNPPVHHKHLGD